MTVFDVLCDICGRALVGPAMPGREDGPYGIRFVYHPGDAARGDDGGLLCTGCWSAARRWLGADRHPGTCARDGAPVTVAGSLHVRRAGELAGWQLCKAHAVEFLNRLRTVDPKLEPETLMLAADWPSQSGNSA